MLVLCKACFFHCAALNRAHIMIYLAHLNLISVIRTYCALFTPLRHITHELLSHAWLFVYLWHYVLCFHNQLLCWGCRRLFTVSGRPLQLNYFVKKLFWSSFILFKFHLNCRDRYQTVTNLNTGLHLDVCFKLHHFWESCLMPSRSRWLL